jgi:hypothetical protein
MCVRCSFTFCLYIYLKETGIKFYFGIFLMELYLLLHYKELTYVRLDIPCSILLLPQVVHIVTTCIHAVFHLSTALCSAALYRNYIQLNMLLPV